MRIRRLKIQNFRGVRHGIVDFPKNALLVGGNNVGKSTICDALELVLGPERIYRRPVVDEHDFHCGHYVPRVKLPDGITEGSEEWATALAVAEAEARTAATIRIEVVLTSLSEEVQRRFANSVRRWSESNNGEFVDESEHAEPEHADVAGTEWALPVVFLGRYDPDEDDFEGGTFLLHPFREPDEDERAALGAGLTSFSREHKRLCGFMFLRALRTGSRALTLQKGSLLDTILRLADENTTEMWEQVLASLRELDPSIGEIAQLKRIRNEVQGRARKFVGLSVGDDATAFFASDLTRETLREFVRLFIATDNSSYLLPFQRHGTGTINVLVFSLLTFIAELKRSKSVIFVMEEPEIALPPHTQRRIARFVLKHMGQAIVTSHSPYVIEQFDRDEVVVLTRGLDGNLSGVPLGADAVGGKLYRTQRRQFAEAVLARAVIVVEGGTEVALCHAVSAALERFRPADDYTHIDVVGATVFNAGSDRAIPKFGPVFSAMQKIVVALVDSPDQPWTTAELAATTSYDDFVEHGYAGIEDLLVTEVPEPAHRRFLMVASDRADYPEKIKKYDPSLTPDEVLDVSSRVLRARKGEADGYAGVLIDCCETEDELPATIVGLLLRLQTVLTPAPPDVADEIDSAPPLQ